MLKLSAILIKRKAFILNFILKIVFIRAYFYNFVFAAFATQFLILC